MKNLMISVTMTLAVGAFSLPTHAENAACEAWAAEKKLAGAAKASFLKKCEADGGPPGSSATVPQQRMTQVPVLSRADFSSVCIRNFTKIWDTLKAQEAPIYPGIDSARTDAASLLIQVLAPCAGYDRDAADKLKDWQDGMQRDIESCKRNSSQPLCSGVNPQNQKGARLLKEQVNLALSNPNYSAELGSARPQPNSTAAQSGSQPDQALRPATSARFEACRSKANSNAKLEGDIARINASGAEATVLLRAALAGISWQLQQYAACADDPKAQSTIAQIKQQRESTLTTCRRIAAIDNCEVPPFNDRADRARREGNQSTTQSAAGTTSAPPRQISSGYCGNGKPKPVDGVCTAQ